MKKLCAFAMTAALCVTAVSASGTYVLADEFKESGTIYVVGDSISSDHNDEENLKENEQPITGWGNVLQNYLSDDVTIINSARSGRSSQSYTRETVYKDVFVRGISAGDYVIVQFGHNDEKIENNGLYTDPEGDSDTEKSFKWYLKTYYIDPALEKGARVILASSVVRYTFENGEMGEQTHEAYAKAMKELAGEYDEGVYFIDTFQITKDLYEQLGEDGAKKFHAVLGLEPDTELDKTHYGPYGAMRIAGILAKELKELGIECCQDIKAAKTMDKEAVEAARSSAEAFAWR